MGLSERVSNDGRIVILWDTGGLKNLANRIAELTAQGYFVVTSWTSDSQVPDPHAVGIMLQRKEDHPGVKSPFAPP